MKILLTGIAGFSGSWVAEEILKNTDWEIIGLDSYNYAGRLDNIAHLDQSRIRLIYYDISHPLDSIFNYLQNVTYVIALAAETHVVNSITNPEPFFATNFMGTFNLLEAARWIKPAKFLYVSTDEVFGPSTTPYIENSALSPSNPYSATKAAGEYLVRAWGRTFGIPYIITRSSNLYGKRQHEEKMVPMTIKKILNHEIVEIHTDSDNNVGSRQWVHVSDQARAIIFLLTNESARDTVYHIAGERKSNAEIADALAVAMNKPLYRKYVDATKKFAGHDLHYSIDDSKIRNLGWVPSLTFEQGLALTI